jgi:uncharacterized protein (TIGR01777 family)
MADANYNAQQQVKELQNGRLSSSIRTVAVTGATGLIGSSLCAALDESNTRVLRLVRRPRPDSVDDILWSSQDGVSEPNRLAEADVVVHLAGESIADGRWTRAKKTRIRESRIGGTQLLCEQIARLENPPRSLICASAIGYYGDRGDEELKEENAGGTGFLADVCRGWEEATTPTAKAGIRVINLRLGVVLSQNGGALQRMLLPFKFGLGGRIGTGRQYWSWISLADVVKSIKHCMHSEQLVGPVNCVAPNPVTNREFTKTLGRVLHRPTFLPLPRIGARLGLGQMADELLLASTRVVPQRLLATGYEFAFPDLESALRAELSSD